MLVFGSYLIVVGGVGLGFFPHHLLSLMGLTAGDDTFVRMAGLLAGILGVNYLLMVRQTAVIFFQLSVLMRYLASLFIVHLVVSGPSHRPLLLLALGDALGASWTLVALRQDGQQAKQRKNEWTP